MIFHRTLLIGFAVLCTAAIGCVRKESGRCEVSGDVTYAGKPTPFGIIQFEPDAQKGNHGPQGCAVIRDGRFDTAGRGGKGASAGPQRVHVFGYDGKGGGEGQSYGNRLFNEYIFETNLPAHAATLHIEVSALP